MMPKEKAKELVDKFEVSFAGIISNDEDWETLAKESALITVEEIIDLDYFSEEGREYWQNVKQEIENF